MRKGQNYGDKHRTLCWDCEKAQQKCSWSRHFKPVKGWQAIPTRVNIGGEKRVYVNSFDVHECPEFELLKIKNNKDEFIKLIKRNIGRIRRDLIE